MYFLANYCSLIDGDYGFDNVKMVLQDVIIHLCCIIMFVLDFQLMLLSTSVMDNVFITSVAVFAFPPLGFFLVFFCK